MTFFTMIMALFLVLLLATFTNQFSNHIVEATTTTTTLDIGVNYGMLGNNLLPHADVINLYKQYNIGKIRLFDPVTEVLELLRGTGIKVTIGVHNQDLPNLAANPNAAMQWFDMNMKPYIDDVQFSYIAVGNEVIPGEFDQYVLPAMQNFHKLLNDSGYAGIRATTVIATSTLGTSFPPSAGAFSDETISVMFGITRFLSGTGAPLLVNAYPYFAYSADPTNVRLDFALLNATEPVVRDRSLRYWNMLDAILDAFYYAMEKGGVRDVDLVVSESGWPSAGNGNFTTLELAETYHRNFVKKFMVRTGTPKRPDVYIEGFIFAIFNENLKPEGVEQNFGLFHPNGTQVYPIFT